ncbi:phage tail tape measure protein, partial [Pseudomonas sp. HMWF007]
FTETLGIQSPSRVFMGYGANISEGAAIGISAQAGLVRQAALGMAAQSGVDLAPPNPVHVSRAGMMGDGGGMSSAGSPGAGGQPVFHFAPQITVPGGAETQQQVQQGLQAGYAEFVRMMDRYMHDKRRRSYGPSDGGLA